ncbi:N-acetyltransferase family protein [Haliea sp. E17]|uniref:GNAT family N-acetyltransferase n=1 Tax=Haliea sp. E17 TaxID=3401576 RepID=UPI003AADAC4C
MLEVVDYRGERHRQAVVAMMARLQDCERALHHSRPPGDEIAAEHFDHLLDCCEQQRGRVYVAEMDGSPVGFVVVMVGSEYPGARHLYERYKTYGIVTDLFVEERSRRHGAAAALMAQAEAYLQSLGIASVQVTSLAANAGAGDFYREAGYRDYELIYFKEL